MGGRGVPCGRMQAAGLAAELAKKQAKKQAEQAKKQAQKQAEQAVVPSAAQAAEQAVVPSAAPSAEQAAGQVLAAEQAEQAAGPVRAEHSEGPSGEPSEEPSGELVCPSQPRANWSMGCRGPFAREVLSEVPFAGPSLSVPTGGWLAAEHSDEPSGEPSVEPWGELVCPSQPHAYWSMGCRGPFAHEVLSEVPFAGPPLSVPTGDWQGCLLNPVATAMYHRSPPNALAYSWPHQPYQLVCWPCSPSFERWRVHPASRSP